MIVPAGRNYESSRVPEVLGYAMYYLNKLFMKTEWILEWRKLAMSLFAVGGTIFFLPYYFSGLIKMDLAHLSVSELKDLLDQTGHELKSREKKDVEAARNEIYAIAHRLGLPLKDLIDNGVVLKPKEKVAAKYRNPSDSSQEWTGRGRQPTWVKELISSGKDLEAARV